MVPPSLFPSGVQTTPEDDPSRGEVCVPNISTAERRRRLAAGVVVFAAGLAALWMLRAAGAERGWQLALLLPFYVAAVCYFQWRDKT